MKQIILISMLNSRFIFNRIYHQSKTKQKINKNP
jgi:hypothetical protein